VTDRGDHRLAERVDEVSLVEFAVAVWSRRWLIAALCVVSVASTFVVSNVVPKTYQSTATVLAPKEGPSSGFLTGLAASGLLPQIPGLSLGSFTPNRDLLVSVLKSRTVREAVVSRFGLQERFRRKYLEDAIQDLQGATTVSITKEGVIGVRIESDDPELASKIANYHVELLDQLVARFSTSEAGRQRGYLTEQLAKAKVGLDAAEESLRRFQEQNRAIVLQEQTKGAIEAAARLKGEIMAAEVQFQVMRNFATEANPEMVTLRRRIAEMNRQLVQMQYGETTARASDGARRDFNVPFAKVPEVGLELARLTRELKTQETLVALLTQQSEQARLLEAKDMPVVQILDRAVPGERPVRPNVMVNVALAGLASLLLGIFVAMFLDSRGRARERQRPGTDRSG
jgi:tyrosine-protein kinase Etk/Wzc